jgi:hypothetical protein
MMLETVTRSRRLRLLLLLVLAVMPALLAPRPVHAVLNDKDVTYYSNAAHTTIVGQCYFSYCSGGDSTCWGVVTQYKTVVLVPCG